jgi:ATP sulfurylase
MAFVQMTRDNIGTSYATNHPDGRSHAGSAIIIRKDIEHYEFGEYETGDIRETSISIEDWDRNLTISVIYCPQVTYLKRNNTIDSLTH